MGTIDREIIRLLREDARRSAREIARCVQLSPGAVRRRITRLEEQGVIQGYTISTDMGRVGAGLEAVTELRFAGDTDIDEITSYVSTLPEVEEVLTMTGDVDALVRLHVDNVHHLQQVVSRMRRKGGRVTGTKTLIVIASWRRGQTPALSHRM